MLPYQRIIDKYYPAGTPLRDIYMSHCRAVADEALAIARSKGLSLRPELIEAAAMLHDIGIYMTYAPSIGCHGTEPYIAHGILGARLLREEQWPETIAAVAERHTGSGITAEDVTRQQLPIPMRDYCPRTELERLICYADKFYSKSGAPGRKPLEKVRGQMGRFSAESLARFDELHRQFG